jgi:hypothetical protein
LVIYTLLCLTASYVRIVHAIAALRDSTSPCIGILISVSACLVISSVSPFLIGNEGNGLTDDITKQADTLIRIPMQGEVESLNAAIACTILTYEAVRQRSV